MDVDQSTVIGRRGDQAAAQASVCAGQISVETACPKAFRKAVFAALLNLLI